MAIPVLKMKAISRGNDEWVVAAAAYRGGEKLYDERAGKEHDYSNRGGVRESGIVLAANAPEWAADRGSLWNGVEANEKRKDAQLAKEITLALPNELELEFCIHFTMSSSTSLTAVAGLLLNDIGRMMQSETQQLEHTFRKTQETKAKRKVKISTMLTSMVNTP